jgi:hypothetical protein
VLGHHRAVQREKRSVAAAANAADDGLAHVLVRAPLDVAGRVRVRGERDDDVRVHPLRDVQEAAHLGVRVLVLRDRGLTAERTEGRERGRHRRERVRLVHHRRDHDLSPWHQTIPLVRNAVISAVE